MEREQGGRQRARVPRVIHDKGRRSGEERIAREKRELDEQVRVLVLGEAAMGGSQHDGNAMQRNARDGARASARTPDRAGKGGNLQVFGKRIEVGGRGRRGRAARVLLLHQLVLLSVVSCVGQKKKVEKKKKKKNA
jgi:hypothetical protein